MFHPNLFYFLNNFNKLSGKDDFLVDRKKSKLKVFARVGQLELQEANLFIRDSNNMQLYLFFNF